MAKKIPISNGFQRLTDEPLDSSSVINTLDDAKHYANSVLSYEGQIIHVNDARIEEDIDNNINIYEGNYCVDNNKNIVPLCQLSYKSIDMLINALYKLNEGSVTNEVFNNLRDELTDSYEKPEVPTEEEGGGNEDKPAYYNKPWDTLLYNDHQIVIRTSQPSMYATEGLNTMQIEGTDFTTETVCAMHNGVMEYYNIYTLEELPTKVSFAEGGRLLLDLVHMCDTSNIEYMAWMFSNCYELKTLDLSTWNVSNVTNMYGMFLDCTNLTSINFDGWDTSKVKEMAHMFSNCESLESLDIKHFDVSRCESFNTMFGNCRSLIELDLSNWDISNAYNINSIFRDCIKLTRIDLSNWDTSNQTWLERMFSGCISLTEIDISSFSTKEGSTADIAYLFEKCGSLTSVILGPLIPNEYVQYGGMFNNTYSLALSGIDMSRCSAEAQELFTQAYNNRHMS